MKDYDYAALLLAVWIAPVMANENRGVWYLMLAIFFALSVVAFIKEVCKRKAARLSPTTGHKQP